MIVDINEQKVKNFVEKRRPPIELRDQIDIGYSFEANTIYIFEIRPDWINPSNKLKLEVAKIRYYKSQKIWKLYWFRASGKWELYAPFPNSSYLGKVLKTIEEDKNACFWG